MQHTYESQRKKDELVFGSAIHRNYSWSAFVGNIQYIYVNIVYQSPSCVFRFLDRRPSPVSHLHDGHLASPPPPFRFAIRLLQLRRTQPTPPGVHRRGRLWLGGHRGSLLARGYLEPHQGKKSSTWRELLAILSWSTRPRRATSPSSRTPRPRLTSTCRTSQESPSLDRLGHLSRCPVQLRAMPWRTDCPPKYRRQTYLQSTPNYSYENVVCSVYVCMYFLSSGRLRCCVGFQREGHQAAPSCCCCC